LDGVNWSSFEVKTDELRKRKSGFNDFATIDLR
jgi:hypothetical protein